MSIEFGRVLRSYLKSHLDQEKSNATMDKIPVENRYLQALRKRAFFDGIWPVS